MSRGAAGPDGLTRKQSLFVAEYLVDLNATQAAIRAKYSPKSATWIGYANLRKPAIRAAIEEKQARRLAQVDLRAEEALRELARIGRARLLDYVRFDADGKPQIDVSRLSSDETAGLSEVTVEEFTTGHGEDRREGRRTTVKLHNKIAALDKLVRHLALLGERAASEPPAEEVPPAPKHSNRQVARAILEVFRRAQEEDGDEDEITDSL